MQKLRKKAPRRWRWGLNPISKKGEHCEMMGRGERWDGRQIGAILHGALNPPGVQGRLTRERCETAGGEAPTRSELPRDPTLVGASPSNPAPPWNRFF